MADGDEAGLAQRSAGYREDADFLVARVRLDPPLELADGSRELPLTGIEPEQPLDQVVDERVLGARVDRDLAGLCVVRLLERRGEELFFELRVEGDLGGDLPDRLEPLCAGHVREPSEERAHRVVIVLEQREGVHASRSSKSGAEFGSRVSSSPAVPGRTRTSGPGRDGPAAISSLGGRQQTKYEAAGESPISGA